MYSCTVSGLVNGAPHNYTARAVNSIGESLDTTAHQTWAYEKPRVTSFTAESVYDPARTSGSLGAVDLTIKGTTDTIAFRVLNTAQDFGATAGEATAEISLLPGPTTFKVVPISQFRPPINFVGANGLGDEYTATPATVAVVGSPSYSSPGSAIGTPTSVTMSGASFNANGGSSGVERFVIWEDGTGEPMCEFTGGALAVVGGSEVTSVQSQKIYWIKACNTNVSGGVTFGVATSVSHKVDTFPTPPDLVGPYSYSVNTSNPLVTGNEYKYKDYSPPSISAAAGMTLRYDIGGTIGSNFVVSDSVAQLRVQQCWSNPGIDKCSGWTDISYATVPTTVTVTLPAAGITQAEAQAASGFSASCGTGTCATISVSPDPLDGSGTVTYTVTFHGDYGALDDIILTTTYIP